MKIYDLKDGEGGRPARGGTVYPAMVVVAMTRATALAYVQELANALQDERQETITMTLAGTLTERPERKET